MRNIIMKMIFFGLLIAGFSTNSLAALAPQYQRSNEMTAVIRAATEKLSPYQPITKIIYQKNDQYLVIAGNCSITAKIVTLPTEAGFVGPRRFEVQLDTQRCKK